jgi:ArsR family transcriptional regulator
MFLSIYSTPRCIEKYPAAAFIENGEEIMKVGFAVEVNEGIESKVFNHFGSAPVFIIVDAASSDITTVNNQDLHHVHGACNPIKALDGQNVDAMVVGGIGAGALSKLNAMGIKVYGSSAATVKENLSLLNAGNLRELFSIHACRGHEGGCGH